MEGISSLCPSTVAATRAAARTYQEDTSASGSRKQSMVPASNRRVSSWLVCAQDLAVVLPPLFRFSEKHEEGRRFCYRRRGAFWSIRQRVDPHEVGPLGTGWIINLAPGGSGGRRRKAATPQPEASRLTPADVLGSELGRGVGHERSGDPVDRRYAAPGSASWLRPRSSSVSSVTQRSGILTRQLGGSWSWGGMTTCSS